MPVTSKEPVEGGLEIRPCRSEDFEGVRLLLAQLWPNQRLDPLLIRSVFDRALVSLTQVYLVAFFQQQVVGFGSLSVKNNLWQQGYLAQVDELVVDSQHRGRGIGTLLLGRLADLARQRGCRRLELDSSFHREAAHRFYEKLGLRKRAYLFTWIR